MHPEVDVSTVDVGRVGMVSDRDCILLDAAEDGREGLEEFMKDLILAPLVMPRSSFRDVV